MRVVAVASGLALGPVTLLVRAPVESGKGTRLEAATIVIVGLIDDDLPSSIASNPPLASAQNLLVSQKVSAYYCMTGSTLIFSC